MFGHFATIGGRVEDYQGTGWCLHNATPSLGRKFALIV
jgi:hypothetical protein